MWDILTWNTVRAILRSLKLSLAPSLALSPYSSVFFIFLSQIRGRGEAPFHLCDSAFHLHWWLVLLLHTGMPDSAECHGPVCPGNRSCFRCHPSPTRFSNTHSLLWLANPSLRPELWPHRSPDRALMDGAGERRESLDVGNKSDRPYWIRPSIIFLIDFTLKGVRACVRARVCPFFLHRFLYFPLPPLISTSALLFFPTSLLRGSRDNAIIYSYAL